jgi:hypothetical protein
VVWAQVPTRVRSNRCGDGRRGLASSGTTHDGDGQVRAARDRAHRWHATFRGRVRSQHVGVGCRLVTTPRKHSSRSPDRWSVRSILSIRIASTEYLLHRRAETSALLLDPSSGYFGFGRGIHSRTAWSTERRERWPPLYVRTALGCLWLVPTQLCSLCTTRCPREDQWVGTSVETKTTTQHSRTTKRAYHCCCLVIMGRSSESNRRTAKLICGPLSGRPMTYTAAAAD